MILGGNQPYYMPYIGYWQLINAVDIFVILDDYNYIKNKWVPRNRILSNGSPVFFRIELDHASSNKKINQVTVREINIEKKLKQLKFSYEKAPYYADGMKVMEGILSCREKNLADFLYNSICVTCEYLDIKTKIVRSSSLHQSEELKREYRIYDMCKRLGADQYYNAIGGQQLYSYEDFNQRGITLSFIKTGDIQYPQFKNSFVPNLSIIDVIMFNSKEEIRKMLENYMLIGEHTYEKK